MFTDPDLYAALVYILRCALVPLAIYNCVWSFKWIIRLVRGVGWPLCIIKAGVFLSSFGLIVLQAIVLMGLDQGTDSAVAVMGFLALVVSQFAFAVMHSTGYAKTMERWHTIFRNADILLPIADLAEVDRKTAVRMAKLARQRTIEVFMRGDALDYD